MRQSTIKYIGRASAVEAGELMTACQRNLASFSFSLNESKKQTRSSEANSSNGTSTKGKIE